MRYSLKCPLCNKALTIEADNNDAALERFLEEGKNHMKEDHPQVPAIPEEQLKAMIRFGMKKDE